MLRVFFIRHAEPDYANDTITVTGLKQAVALANKLTKIGIDFLFCSPLGRARETAKPIAEKIGLKITILDWLCELNGNFGHEVWAWDVPGTEVLGRGVLPEMHNWHSIVPYGELMLPQWRMLAQNFDKLIAEFGYIRDGLRYRVSSPNDMTLVFVAHAGTILTLLSYLVNFPLPLAYIHFSCDPSSVTELIWERRGEYAVPRLVRLNDMSHWRP
jgi:probable phosphoglycerate mutase